MCENKTFNIKEVTTVSIILICSHCKKIIWFGNSVDFGAWYL
jgi:hypothetical protein